MCRIAVNSESRIVLVPPLQQARGRQVFDVRKNTYPKNHGGVSVRHMVLGTETKHADALLFPRLQAFSLGCVEEWMQVR